MRSWFESLVDDGEKIPRRHGLDAELLAAQEMSGVVSDNVAAAGGKRQFENHVVVGVGQERPPQKEDVLEPGLAGEKA